MKRPAIIFICASLAAWGLYRHGNTTKETDRAVQKTPTVSVEVPLAISASQTTLQSLLGRISAWKPGSAAASAERIGLLDAMAGLDASADHALGAELGRATSLEAKKILAEGLARRGSPDAVQALLQQLYTITDPHELKALARSFDTLTPGPGIETLASSLAHELRPELKDAVTSTISRTADPGTITLLKEMFHEPETFPGKVNSILATLATVENPAAAPALQDILNQTRDLALMRATATSLSKIATPEALQAVANTVLMVGETNPSFRTELLQLIENVSSPESLPWLQSAADGAHGDQGIASAAQQAKQRLRNY